MNSRVAKTGRQTVVWYRIVIHAHCYWGDDFNKELSAVAEKVSLKTGGIILEGVLALGEIAGDGERPLEFYNKTFVISIFYG